MDCFLPILYTQMHFFLKEVQRSNSVTKQSRNFTFTIALNSTFANATSATLSPGSCVCFMLSLKHHTHLAGYHWTRLLTENYMISSYQSCLKLMVGSQQHKAQCCLIWFCFLVKKNSDTMGLGDHTQMGLGLLPQGRLCLIQIYERILLSVLPWHISQGIFYDTCSLK